MTEYSSNLMLLLMIIFLAGGHHAQFSRDRAGGASQQCWGAAANDDAFEWCDAVAGEYLYFSFNTRPELLLTG